MGTRDEGQRVSDIQDKDPIGKRAERIWTGTGQKEGLIREKMNRIYRFCKLVTIGYSCIV